MDANAWLPPSLSSGLPRFSAIITAASARWEASPAHEVALEDDAARAQGGGPLTGLVTIPKFRNCGVGENLDPIFNAAISGPRNFNLLTQGPVCFLVGGGGVCPPPKPKPLHAVSG